MKSFLELSQHAFRAFKTIANPFLEVVLVVAYKGHFRAVNDIYMSYVDRYMVFLYIYAWVSYNAQRCI